MQWRIGLIGYGEVGRIFAQDLRAKGLQVCVHDTKANALNAQSAELMDHAHRHGVQWKTSHAQVCANSDLVVCAVTASQTLAAAQACAPHLLSQAFFLDLNSASPGTKKAAATDINQNGARYVEAAVMTSVPPYRTQVPMLLGGAFAAQASTALNQLGWHTRVASDQLGVASATKMSRSIMIKGMEAMVIESLCTARHHGVEDAVIASLYETFPGVDWEKQASYFFQRVIEHGRRRSEEMHEVAVTVSEVGLTPWLATATAQRQSHMADLADAGVFGNKADAGFARNPDWRIEADRLLHSVSTNQHKPST